ncbi:MAG: 3-oxoacyl-ACP reductase FabG [Clostridia bacterium]|nr:3-oxoacyl-ACP reductase FabG [Clostridia bacterium]
MKTVLITGGSRGIGRAMVELFSKKGYRVAFTYKCSGKAAEELSLATGALAICADTTSENDVKKAVAITKEKLGNVEILINNSAVSHFSLFTDLSLEEWRAIFSENVDGVFLYTREALPDMINAKCGRIINVSSMWGIVGASCEVAYSASKAAIIGMTKALAKELGPSGITVNCIAPGVINTEMNARLSDEDITALCDETPVMRLGAPEEVAAAALFLASDEAAFITGDVMNVSGGYIT